MLFTTTTQWVALAVALVAGWLFGLASHPGGRRWKQRYADEREAHAVYRRDQDARIAELNARVRELEQENARLARAAPVTAATVAPHAHAANVARPAYPKGSGGGWFEWRNRVRPTV
ncbi:hypothetical protein [Sphingomonas sp.]|jgi:hypothetical protein|uniref:hypothetical protein n=1 Tax=Sphingomonas sp. TaxID=28214 RepID=UPI0035C86651